jgi:hypothetical protein
VTTNLLAVLLIAWDSVSGKDADDALVIPRESNDKVDEVVYPLARAQRRGLTDDHRIGMDTPASTSRHAASRAGAEHGQVQAERDDVLTLLCDNAIDRCRAIRFLLTGSPK